MQNVAIKFLADNHISSSSQAYRSLTKIFFLIMKGGFVRIAKNMNYFLLPVTKQKIICINHFREPFCNPLQLEKCGAITCTMIGHFPVVSNDFRFLTNHCVWHSAIGIWNGLGNLRIGSICAMCVATMDRRTGRSSRHSWIIQIYQWSICASTRHALSSTVPVTMYDGANGVAQLRQSSAKTINADLVIK